MPIGPELRSGCLSGVQTEALGVGGETNLTDVETKTRGGRRAVRLGKIRFTSSMDGTPMDVQENWSQKGRGLSSTSGRHHGTTMYTVPLILIQFPQITLRVARHVLTSAYTD